MGTDATGRDLVTGLVSGACVSLVIGRSSALVATAAGPVVGTLSGYFGGRTDAALMRLTELFQTVPQFLLAVVLVAVLQPSAATVVLAIGIVSWPPTPVWYGPNS